VSWRVITIKRCSKFLIRVSITNSAATTGAIEYYMQDRLIGVLRAEEHDKRDSINSPLAATDTVQGKLLTHEKQETIFTLFYALYSGL
jgi:hypothetical protein